ncbi:MAG: hypothetical protein M1838_004691 [Thelocarpon superellum]|nr:MAG: hypothetical protein M1838_004691 [Thelocarpon superellum]
MSGLPTTHESSWRQSFQSTLALASMGMKKPRFYIAATVGALLLLLFWTIHTSDTSLAELEVPSVTLDFHSSPFNSSRLALLVENRKMPNLVPLMLHMMSVVPPEWRFNFMGSEESVAQMNGSAAIRRHVSSGKLDLTLVPSNMSVASAEEISQFFTTLWLYDTVLAPAEHLFVFQTDSILCANSEQSLNDWIDYDWIGAPWMPEDRWGGNGGLSLRRVSAIKEILQHQERRVDSQAEDGWLSDRLAARPGARVANASESGRFSSETLFSERPMAYHIGGSGTMMPAALHPKKNRQQIYEYCPEFKLILEVMDVDGRIPEGCALGDTHFDDGSY